MGGVIDNFSLEEIFRVVLDGKAPYSHQLKTVENIARGNSVVLRAPCGSGKTEATARLRCKEKSQVKGIESCLYRPVPAENS
jgi:CRISPR/Cas system-associated endonuclease/helicase Cas3